MAVTEEAFFAAGNVLQKCMPEVDQVHAIAPQFTERCCRHVAKEHCPLDQTCSSSTMTAELGGGGGGGGTKQKHQRSQQKNPGDSVRRLHRQPLRT